MSQDLTKVTMFERLPSESVDLGNVSLWVNQNRHLITMETVLNNPTRADILLMLLRILRGRTRSTSMFHTSELRFAARTEQSYRQEVHSKPSDFMFSDAALREYHPIHLGEMIQIILGRLLELGIDAKSERPGPKLVQNVV